MAHPDDRRAPTVRAYSPGRVNLMGDHTDYNQGLALPMAVDLGTVVTFTPDDGGRVRLRSEVEPEPADVDLHVSREPGLLQALELHD
jgi:galactokinase